MHLKVIGVQFCTPITFRNIIFSMRWLSIPTYYKNNLEAANPLGFSSNLEYVQNPINHYA